MCIYIYIYIIIYIHVQMYITTSLLMNYVYYVHMYIMYAAVYTCTSVYHRHGVYLLPHYIHMYNVHYNVYAGTDRMVKTPVNQ